MNICRWRIKKFCNVGPWLQNLAADILGHFIKGQSSNVVLMFDALWRIFYCVLYLIHSKHRTTLVKAFLNSV
jgi:hypothetical protein